MKLIWLNFRRSPLRTVLTILGTAVALALVCLIEALLAAFQAGVEMSSASRLIVQHKESLTFFLPEAHQARIAEQEGIKRVARGVWFGGLYEAPLPGGGKRDEFFANFAVGMEEYLAMYPEMVVPPAQVRELLRDPGGCLIGDGLATRLGKGLGDTIALKSPIFGRANQQPWEFSIRAIYTTTSSTFDRTMMAFHYRHLEEWRTIAKGMVGFYWAEVKDPNRVADAAAAIDRRFANSPHETRTMTEKAFNLQFVSMMGNLQLLFRFVGIVVILTMLLINANTMMMSGRERLREMAILKALGFSDAYVFFLMIGEPLVVAFFGMATGAGGTFFLINVAGWNPKPDFFPIFQVPVEALGACALLALLTGILSGLLPALAGLRLKAAQALRAA